MSVPSQPAHVVTCPPGPTRLANTRLDIHCVPMAYDNLGWLLVDRATATAAIVDGTDAGGVLETCAALGVTLTTIINTHTHHDHIGVNRDLEKRGLLAAMRVIGPAIDTTPVPVPGLTEPVGEGDRFTFADATFTTMRTEGHLAGHVCHAVSDVVFCGDIMFGCGCGRVFTGPPEALFASLQRLAALPPETRLYCAHEYTATNIAFALGFEPDNAALVARQAETAAVRAGGGCTIPLTLAVELATNPFVRTHLPSIQAAVSRALPAHEGDNAERVFVGLRQLRNGFRTPGV